MWTESWLLARHELRRMRWNTAYWLRLIGFEANASRAYRVYLAGFWAFWLFSMWAFITQQVYQMSQAVPRPDAVVLFMTLPGIIFSLQLGYTIQTFHDAPLKLPAADLQYMTAAPVSRRAMTLVTFVRSLLIPAALLSLLGTLAALFFAWRFGLADVGIRGLLAYFLTFGLVWVSGAAAWNVGLVRQNRPYMTGRYARWLVISVILVGLELAADFLLLPGYIRADFLLSAAVVLVAGGIVAFGLLSLIGSRMHMTAVMDHSQLYARIQQLGTLGRLLAGDTVARIQKQSRLARKKTLRTRLPVTSDPHLTLFGQQAVTLARLSPGVILRLIGTGITLSSLVIVLIMIGDYRALQTWLLVFILLIQFRPNDLTRLFREQMHQPFLRQFLPANPLLLFASQALLPLLLMSGGMFIVIALQPGIPLVAGWGLAVGVLVALGLCQALNSVRLGFSPVRLRYEYTMIAAGVVVIVAGVGLHSLWAALLVSLIVDGLLAGLLYTSKPSDD